MKTYEFLKRNYAILLSQVIVKFIPYFTSDYNELLTKHIPHEHSTEMATKSEIVSVIVIVITLVYALHYIDTGVHQLYSFITISSLLLFS